MPWGAYYGLERLATQEFGKRSPYSDDAAARALPISLSAPGAQLKGAWRTPSLRDVAMTGPYMHDGLFATLSDVLWHYNQAGGSGAASGGEGRLELSRLGLSAGEREDLVAFLWSLTGERPAAPLLTTPLAAAPVGALGSERGQ